MSLNLVEKTILNVTSNVRADIHPSIGYLTCADSIMRRATRISPSPFLSVESLTRYRVRRSRLSLNVKISMTFHRRLECRVAFVTSIYYSSDAGKFFLFRRRTAGVSRRHFEDIKNVGDCHGQRDIGIRVRRARSIPKKIQGNIGGRWPSKRRSVPFYIHAA